MIDATKPRCLLVHTPHTVAVLTPTGAQHLSLRFEALLDQRLSPTEQQQLQTMLAGMPRLPVDLALSTSLLPIAQHPVPDRFDRLALRRFLRHHYPSRTQHNGYCVRHADQRTYLLSCALPTTTLRTLLRFWNGHQLKLRSLAPLASLVPGTFSHMPGTHLLLFKPELERSLAVMSTNRLHAIINRDASFEDLFRSLTQHAPHCAWERGVNLLTTPAPQAAALDYTAWLDAWYWFAE